MSAWVYILKCADNSYYTGSTVTIEKRLGEHHSGIIACYTRTRRPLKLVFSQEFVTTYEAICAERQIKGWTRKKKEALMALNFDLLVELARSKLKKSSWGHTEPGCPEPASVERVEVRVHLFIAKPPSTSSGWLCCGFAQGKLAGTKSKLASQALLYSVIFNALWDFNICFLHFNRVTLSLSKGHQLHYF